MSNDRPWLDNYPPGVPADIDITQYRSIVDVLEESFEKYRDRPAFTSFGKTVTYGEVDELSNQFAGYLAGELKLAKGDRIAIMLLNVIQYPVALFAALRLGLVVVNTNPLYTPRELEHQLKDSGAKALIVLDNFAATAQEALKVVPVPHVITTGIGDLLGVKGAVINFVLKHVKKMVPAFHIDGAVRFGDALSRGGRHETTSPDVSREDIAFLQYTGGTTGVAKGAMLTHGNMVANMLQAGAWFGKQIRPGEEIIITALPLYHIFALTCNCFIFLRFGGQSILITNPRDMPGFVKELSKRALHRHHRRQHAVQRAGAHRGLRQARLLVLAHEFRRRHGRATRCGREMAGHYRLPADRRLRHDRKLTRGHHQPDDRGRELLRAPSACRYHPPR